MSRLLHRLARRLGIYHRLRYSSFYHFLLKIKNPAYVKSLHNDLAFYRQALGERVTLIFDIGAYHGDKAWVFVRLAKRVVCVEPDAECFAALTARFGRDARVALENVAVGDHEHTTTFFVEEDGSAYNTLSPKWNAEVLRERRPAQPREVPVQVATLDQLITKYGTPDYLKIDVEGYELQAVRGLHHRIPILSFEANLPVFQDETLRILDHFQQGNPAASFNLRLGDTFVFPAHQSAEAIRPHLQTEAPVTYDVFVYNPS